MHACVHLCVLGLWGCGLLLLQKAIAKASTLEEINRLENALANGVMPEGLEGRLCLLLQFAALILFLCMQVRTGCLASCPQSHAN